MAGKGDKLRPRQISRKQFEENWEKAFGKKPSHEDQAFERNTNTFDEIQKLVNDMPKNMGLDTDR